jgi:hypothetical protein
MKTGVLLRARVLKVEGDQVALGVLVDGRWQRIIASTTVPLIAGSWVMGRFLSPQTSGEKIQFQMVGQS